MGENTEGASGAGRGRACLVFSSWPSPVTCFFFFFSLLCFFVCLFHFVLFLALVGLFRITRTGLIRTGVLPWGRGYCTISVSHEIVALVFVNVLFQMKKCLFF